MDRRELGRRLDGFAHTVNDDVLADRALRAKQLRRFSLTPGPDGAWTAAGQLEPVAGATLHGLLGRLARRHGPDDQRSQPQRMADALAAVTSLAAGNPALRTADPAGEDGHGDEADGGARDRRRRGGSPGRWPPPARRCW